MIERIPQRSETDCAICTVAMVMGHLYSFERVLSDSDKYPKISEEGKYYTWWETYLTDEGFHMAYRPFLELYNLPGFAGRIVGLLGFDMPRIKFSHIVAVDELGIIDPTDNMPSHFIYDYGLYVSTESAEESTFGMASRFSPLLSYL